MQKSINNIRQIEGCGTGLREKLFKKAHEPEQDCWVQDWRNVGSAEARGLTLKFENIFLLLKIWTLLGFNDNFDML